MTFRSILTLLAIKFTKHKKIDWLFRSFNGEYSDSPKVLSELLHERQPNIPIYWIVDGTNNMIPDYIVRIPPNSIDAQIALHSANVIVDNVYGENAYTIRRGLGSYIKAKVYLLLRKRKGQKIYTTWHGVPLKKMGRDQCTNSNHEIVNFLCNDITMFVNSLFQEKIMSHITFDNIKMCVMGSPRNDLLFHHEYIEQYKNKIGIDASTHIILYAPTFRNDCKVSEDINIGRSGLYQLNELDFDALFAICEKKFGGNWVFVCRFHYNVNKKLDWESINNRYCGKIINGNILEDMADYLVCTDILITDASSCMFDFMLTKRPCFLFFPDLDNYSTSERGLYESIDSLPFPTAFNSFQLINLIDMFDINKYIQDVDKLITRYGLIDDGESGRRIIEYILEDINK